MDFFGPTLAHSQENKLNILTNIQHCIAYGILVQLNEDDLTQVRRSCPAWKKLLDRDEFWEMKLIRANLKVSSVIRSSNIEEFVSYFKSRHHGIFRYFNRLKWNWQRKWFQQVNIQPDIMQVFYIDEETLIFQQPDIVNPDDDIYDRNGIKIANPGTGQVFLRLLSLNMAPIVRIKKSGRYIIIEDNLHKLTSFHGYTNTILSELQESSRLTHLKMYENIVLIRTSNDSMLRIWDASNGKIECKFYDACANVNVDFEKCWIATDNVNDRRVRIWKLTDGELVHATCAHSSPIKQILIQDFLLIVVECSGRISIKYWMQENYMNKEIVYYGRPNSKIRRLVETRFAYIQLDTVFNIQNPYTGNCLQTIGTQKCIQKIKSNSQLIFVLCQDLLLVYDINNYNFLQIIDYPFYDNTLVYKLTESKLLFQEKHPAENSLKQVCLYNFSPRSLLGDYCLYN